MNEKSLEYIKCNLCDGEETNILLEKNSFYLVKCKRCGLVYTNPRLKESISYERYDNGNLNSYLSALSAANEFLIYLEVLKNSEIYRNKNKILDIGCGTGLFLKKAREEKWNVFGIELSEIAIDYAKKNYNLDLIKGELKDVKFPDGYFDVITMWEVIEHLQNPKEELKEIFRILREGGLLFLSTPNFNSLNFILRKKNWCIINPSDHIYYFTPKTLKKLLKNAGFKIRNLRTFGFNITNTILTLNSVFASEKLYSQFRRKIYFKKFLKPSVNFLLNLFRWGDTIILYAEK